VTSTDGTTINFNAAVSYSTAATGWLFLSTATGVTPTNLSITANPASLGIGTYTATITLTATSPTTVANSPQIINVTFNVTPNATLSASPASLAFAQNLNGAAPAAQTLTITSSTGGAISFSAAATTSQGGAWLSVSPASATTPGTLTVTANSLVSGLALQPGTYQGQITISSPGASNTLNVPVTLTISNVQTITASPASLTPVSYQIGAANPATQTVAVSVSTGVTTSYTAAATTSTGGAWLSVSPTAGALPGNVVVSFNPAGLTAGTYQGAVTITVAGATNSPLSLPVTLTVTPAPVVAPSAVAIQNAASSLSTSISPGLIILIYGSNMGPATLTQLHVGANGLLDTTLSDTLVTFDGIPAPVIYTSAGLVSVIVPYEVAGRASVSMVVSYKGTPSTPLQLRVVDVSPAIFTQNSSGTGQGAILNENGTINSAGNPEAVGKVVQIFGTGEGLTSPRSVTGSISPSRLPLPTPVLPVTVTIGGIPVPAADIFYAGEAPGGVAGLIQINARIPDGVGSGAQRVFFTIGGSPSQGNVTVSVR
jgi:uncharacterized protein (TIGR03437 family)